MQTNMFLLFMIVNKLRYSALCEICFRHKSSQVNFSQVKSSQFYLTYTEYYVHKVRMISQYCFTKMEEEGKISLIICGYGVEFGTPK